MLLYYILFILVWPWITPVYIAVTASRAVTFCKITVTSVNKKD